MVERFTDGFGNEVPRPTLPFLTVIHDGIRAGKTQAGIQADIREAKRDLGMRVTGIRDDFLRQAIRFLKGEANINPPPDFRFIAPEKSPDPTRLRPSTGTTTRQFSYRVAITAIQDDGTVDDEAAGHVTVSSSIRLSRQRIIDEARKMIDGKLEQYTTGLPDQFRLDIVDAIRSDDFLLSSGGNFA